MALNMTFLGTSSMVPTKERNVQSIHLDYNGEGILVDCGEGTQRQMNIAGINRIKVKKVLISHWHGDHVSGLIGLIQTIGSVDRPDVLEIYGPKETKKRMEHLLNTCIFDLRIKLKIHELIPTKDEILTFYENEDYNLQCTLLNHGVPCLGFSFVIKDKLRVNMKKVEKLGLKSGAWLKKIQKNEVVKVQGKEINPKDITTISKGKKVSFILDTCYCDNAVELAKNSDILISESVYEQELNSKAKEYNHMTSVDAAKIAKNSNSKKLILTHISQRYKSTKQLEKDAKTIFKDVIVAEDFMKVKL
jgi:ribonuclease Z